MAKFRELNNFVRDAIKALPDLADVPVYSYDETDCQAKISQNVQKFAGLFVSVEIPGGDVGQQERHGPHFPELPIYIDVWTIPIFARSKTVSEPLKVADRDPLDTVETIMEGLHRLASAEHSPSNPVSCSDRFFVKRWSIMPPRDEQDPFVIYRVEIIKSYNLNGTL